MHRRLLPSALALGALLSVTVACEQKGGGADVLPDEPQSEIEKVCGRAYGGMDGFRDKQLQGMTAEQGAQMPPLPTKAEFTKLCTGIEDTDLARCLDPNWFQVNAKECDEGFKKLPEDQTKEIMAMLSGKPAEEKKEEVAGEGEGAE
ncbi:MAG: hypothetical protein VX899_12185 [Myxococcota bacterium]|nr:hypothetical protein [Myxococcota bacterium]